MGRSNWSVARTVVLPQLIPAIGAGALLAALYALSDFGAVSILRFDSFTRVIYQSYRASFDRTGAAALAALLVLVMIGLLAARGARTPRAHVPPDRTGQRARRPVVRLGGWRWPSLAFCAAVTLLAFVLPVAMLVYWSAQSVAGDVDWDVVTSAAGNSLLLASLAALRDDASRRCPSRGSGRASRGAGLAVVDTATTTGYALPGIVVALALVFFGIRAVPVLYQSLAMLVLAMVVLFLPLAVGSARAALLQVPPRLEEAARVSGRSPLGGRMVGDDPARPQRRARRRGARVPGDDQGAPGVVLLSPIGFETLPLVIWQETTRSFFESGAVPALVLLAVSAPPLWLLVGRTR